MTQLHLAYLKTIKGLIENNKKELIVATVLTLRACKVFEKLRYTSLVISFILLSIQAYLLKVIGLNTLLEYINKGIKGLNKLKAYVKARVPEIIKNELEKRIKENRDIDEEFLRLSGVKLLGVL